MMTGRTRPIREEKRKVGLTPWKSRLSWGNAPRKKKRGKKGKNRKTIPDGGHRSKGLLLVLPSFYTGKRKEKKKIDHRVQKSDYAVLAGPARGEGRGGGGGKGKEKKREKNVLASSVRLLCLVIMGPLGGR